VPDQAVGASFGDAYLAGLAAGALSRGDLASWVRGGTRVDPDAVANARCREDQGLFRRLDEETKGTVHALQGRARAGG
jgi:xylulokinase